MTIVLREELSVNQYMQVKERLHPNTRKHGKNDSLIPIRSSLLPNFLYPFFVIHQNHKALRFPSHIVSLIPPTGVYILKIGQRLHKQI